MQKKRFIQRLLLMLCMMATSLWAHAASVEYLTLMVNGSPVVIVLAEHPVITYSNNTLHIQTAKEAFEVAVNEIGGAEFSETTSIKSAAVEKLLFLAGSINFSALPVGSQVSVYTTEGICVQESNASNNGDAVVDLNNLPAGIYVVKSAKQTLKITKK